MKLFPAYRPLLLGLLLPVIAAPSVVRADDKVADPLYVIRPLLHADREPAELCLEFDHDLDAVGDAAHLSSLAQLERDDKAVPLSGKNISIGGNQICVTGLEHRASYRLALAALHSAKGEKLSRAYSLSFTVPPRRAALSFLRQQSRDGVSLWHDNPLLQSVNNGKVALELYRITDPAKLAAAWQGRLQTSLAPSESLYFARHNGTLVTKQDIAPDDQPDHTVTTPIAMPSPDGKDFPPGLYLLAANDADKVTKSETGKDDKDNALTPAAALWLLRSDLAMQIFRDGTNLIATVNRNAPPYAADNLHLLLMDRDAKILAEAHTDAHGLAQLTPPPNSAEPQMVVGIGEDGAPVFADLTQKRIATPTLPPLRTSLSVDPAIAEPRDSVTVVLTAQDLHQHALNLKNTNLQLQRPDRSIYDSFPVTLDGGGRDKITFAAPFMDGMWHLVWQQNDGSALAETAVRISRNPAAPQIVVTADHTQVAADGTVTLTLRSETPGKKPVPYLAGTIRWQWVKTTHPFSSWTDYVFDDGKPVNSTPITVAGFVTDQQGRAQLHIAVPPAKDASALRQAQISVVGDPSADALDPEPLILQVKPATTVLGLKPSAAKSSFPENSVAHFDVIALDGDGQRHPLDNLTYQIYEEGRSFEWFQADGHWDYKPLQQRRRIGGGSLVFNEGGQSSIDWPVTSGTYQVEISDENGTLIASTGFTAGWGSALAGSEVPGTLPLLAEPAALGTGMPENINFTLPYPAFVTTTIADDHLRSVSSKAYPAGAVTIPFLPAADWGTQIKVRVEAEDMANGIHHAPLIGKIVVQTPNPAAILTAHAAVKPAAAATGVSATPDMAVTKLTPKTLAPQQSLSLPAEAKAGLAFLAPRPLYDAPALLAGLLRQTVVTSADLADELTLLRLWHSTIVDAGLLTETEFRARSNDLLLRLLARQKPDGGFAALPGDASPSTMASTAAAVTSLAAMKDGNLTAALDQAARWLAHRLENTWFDEQMREPRAAAYAALAIAGKLDLGSLHYFSDTSADKALSPTAMANIAYSFAAINDKAASNFWTDKATHGDNPTPPVRFDHLPTLLDNRFFTSPDVAHWLQGASAKAMANPDSIHAAYDFLMPLGLMQDRAGPWKIVIGKEEKTLHGVEVMQGGDKAALALRNPSQDQVLHLVLAHAEHLAPGKSSLQRHIYTLDGEEVTGSLKRGTTYLTLLQGAWPGEGLTFWLHDNPAPVLQPLTCAIDAPQGDGFLGWLSYKAPNPVSFCERSGGGIDLAISHGGNEAKDWRVAYLVKAFGDDRRQIPAAKLQPLPVSPDDKDGQH